jgi:hypothetical protein
MSDDDRGHGITGRQEQQFTQLLAPRGAAYDPRKLAALALGMASKPDNVSDGPDPEENLFLPAGYTYFGQFIDHDLTLDTTSTLNPDDIGKAGFDPSNTRSPRFDLDCVYGTGPGDQPYLYAQTDGMARGIQIYHGASLQFDEAGFDLQRAPNGRALIGDKRNDENSIVNQIQQLFITFHNRVVEQLAGGDFNLRERALFEAARDQVRWAYQQIIVDDFLPRIIDQHVLDGFAQSRATTGQAAYQLFKPGAQRDNLPREFVAAAYRFGHSGVRTGYRLNARTIRPIFNTGISAFDSLVGFQALPHDHQIDDWGRLFPRDLPVANELRHGNLGESRDIADPLNPPADALTGVRLQYAYKLDPSITEPLTHLPAPIAGNGDVFPPDLRMGSGPSLALLNLLRGNRYMIQGGQAFESALQLSGSLALNPERYLRVRTVTSPDGANGKTYTFKHIRDLRLPGGPPIGDAFNTDTPLWFYLLAEAQKPVVDFWFDHGQQDLTEDDLKGVESGSTVQPLADDRCTATRLGMIGGTIVAEVFYGLLDADEDSLFNRGARAHFSPIWGSGAASIAKLIEWIHVKPGVVCPPLSQG